MELINKKNLEEIIFFSRESQRSSILATKNLKYFFNKTSKDLDPKLLKIFVSFWRDSIGFNGEINTMNSITKG